MKRAEEGAHRTTDQIVESTVGIDDVSLTREAWQQEMRVFEERRVYQHVLRPLTKNQVREL